jgi:hypothetical protein
MLVYDSTINQRKMKKKKRNKTKQMSVNIPIEWQNYISGFFPKMNALVLGVLVLSILNLYLEVNECADSRGCYHIKWTKTVCKSNNCKQFSIPLIVITVLLLILMSPPSQSRMGPAITKFVLCCLAVGAIVTCSVSFARHTSKNKNKK